MTAAIVNYNRKNKVVDVSMHVPTGLVPVVFKRSRLTGFKVLGEILNPHANHGKSFVTRRLMGQDPIAIMAHMKAIIDHREEAL